MLVATREAEIAKLFATPSVTSERRADGSFVVRSTVPLGPRARPRWDLERQVRLAAGGLVLAAVLAGTVFPPATWVAALVGGGLAVAAITDTCLLGKLLTALPYNRGPRTTVAAVVAALAVERG
jgi:hypothetical protein